MCLLICLWTVNVLRIGTLSYLVVSISSTGPCIEQMLYKKWTKKITISYLSVCLFILHPKKSLLYIQWHLIKAYHLHFFIQVSYFEFYLGLFMKYLYLQKQNTFLKQNKSLFLLEKNPLVERKIKLLKVMTTEKRSNQCLWHNAVHAALDGAFVRGSPLQNLTRTKPFFKTNHPWLQYGLYTISVS